MLEKTDMEPFSSKDIQHFRTTIDTRDDSWHGFKLGKDSEFSELYLADVKTTSLPELRADIFQLRLDNALLEQINDVEPTSLPTTSYKRDESGNENGSLSTVSDASDLWDLSLEAEDAATPRLLCWDTFSEQQEVPQTKYLSETTCQDYDLISHQVRVAGSGEHLRFVKQDHLKRALFNVVVGHSSEVFRWNAEHAVFELTIENFALTGYSVGCTASLCRTICNCGSSFRRIRLFCETEKPPHRTWAALQTSATHLLHAIERHHVSKGRTTGTILELMSSIDQYAELLDLVEEVTSSMSLFETERQSLTRLIGTLDDAWTSNIHLRPVLSQIAAQVLTPTLWSTLQQLRLAPLQLESGPNSAWLLAALLPDVSATYEETIDCLAIAHQHIAPHMRQASGHTQSVLVQSWSEAVTIHNNATDIERQYAQQLTNENESASVRSYTKVPDHSGLVAKQTNPFLVDFDVFGAQPAGLLRNDSRTATLQDLIFSLLEKKNVEQQHELAPLLALRSSVVPFLEVQHRISSYQLMDLLFLQHNLGDHLNLLHSFSLFGDGRFASKLSRALFDVDQSSVETVGKTGLTAGLRLEDREIWPPASSELRLVLMGFLPECVPARGENVLECMSFAIRDLDEDELELCRDVHSLHALDFLRLSYTPSCPMLELILTPAALDKYDQIFRFMLKLLRLDILSRTLITNIVCKSSSAIPTAAYHRFCVEFHHLTSTLLDFALTQAINTPSQRYLKHVEKIEHHLRKGSYGESTRLAGSIAQLRRLHEECLDDMLKALLLKRKQAQLYNGLCDLLCIGLEFAATQDQSYDKSQNTYKLYHDLKTRMSIWLRQIRAMSNHAQDEATRRLGLLLLGLDITGYYDDSAS